MILTINEAIDFINSDWPKSSLGLNRVTELLELLGNPHKKLKLIHIAGTNGKGSTASMLASVYAEAGYKTGLYTSPYIHTFAEQIKINSSVIDNAALVNITNSIQECIGFMKSPPTLFEIITAMAFLHFYQKRCDIVVLEVGMGGRLDATNVIDTPEAAIITSIGLDHTEWLGGTFEKIAFEKAGIIKQGSLVVCHPQIESVERVIRNKCHEQNAKAHFVDDNAIKLADHSLNGQRFEYGDTKDIMIPLLGEHQLTNAACCIETVYALAKRGWQVSEEALRNGLKKASWPGRFEVMMRKPVFIVDGAHNPQGIYTAVNSLQIMFPGKKIIFLFGVLADKDYKKMIEILTPYAKCFLTIAPEDGRALPAKDLAACVGQSYDGYVSAYQSVTDGVHSAIEQAREDDIICALGSLAMVGSLRKSISNYNNF